MDHLLARELRERPPAADRVPAGGRATARPLSALSPFDVLYEARLPALPRCPLPADLERVYGRFGFRESVVYSNFVISLDGVVALGSAPNAGSVISGRNPADRFLMGLLRACADAVLVGAGTLRATPSHRWTAEHVFPDLKEQWAALRRRLGRSPEPRLVVLTASGNVDLAHPAVKSGATFIAGRDLKSRLPDSCDLIAGDLKDGLAELRRRGLDVVLTEGGPHVMGELIARSLLDEAFITISPVIAGRDIQARLGMVHGLELLPRRGLWSGLMSARRHGDHLFLRYDLRSRASP